MRGEEAEEEEDGQERERQHPLLASWRNAGHRSPVIAS
jgi:hypothetical protein